MNVSKLTIKNIGAIADMALDLNKPLLIFYGEIMQGKSTILNAVRWVCGGKFPSDIIRHGEKEASIMLEFDGGMIARSWYVNAKNETVDRPVTFVRDGKPVPAPIAEIKRMLNPFMLDQDHLVKMGELDRKRFFTELFAVDTADLDKQIWNKSNEASSLRSKISGYGVIDATPVLKVDAASLEEQLKAQRKSNNELISKWGADDRAVLEHNSTVQRGVETKASLEQQIKELQEKLDATNKWLAKNPAKIRPQQPALVDPEPIETKLREAGAQNVRHENYLAALERSKQKQADEQKLLALEADQRKLKEEKIARLKNLNDSCKVKGLKFTDDGSFIYQDTQAGMLSTSQLMTLSSELSALYPEGLGVELLDRGESLGKSIFGFVDRAQREKITILATVVGEKPASVPENIGVFVVAGGKIQ